MDSYDGIGTNPATSGDPYWQGGNTYTFTGPNYGAQWDKDLKGGEVGTDQEFKWTQMPRYRHAGVANFAFADGHVKAIAKGQLNWCKNFYYPGIVSPYDGGASMWLFDPGNACASFPK